MNIKIYNTHYNVDKTKILDTSNKRFTSEDYEKIGELTNLKNLTINSSYFITSDDFRVEELPKNINNLKKLEILTISYTNIKSLPKKLTRLKNLKELYIKNNNELESIKDFADNYNTNIQNINGSLNEDVLTKISSFLPKLTKLVISDNPKLTEIPKSISNLEHLKILHLKSSLFKKNYNLQNLPDEIGKLTALTNLHIEGYMGLEMLPKTIGNLKNLTELWISFTAIKELPDEIGKLKNLTNLIINYNQNMNYFPNSIVELTKLQQIGIVHTPINTLPDNIERLLKQNLKFYIDTPNPDLYNGDVSKNIPLKDLLPYNNDLRSYFDAHLTGGRKSTKFNSKRKKNTKKVKKTNKIKKLRKKHTMKK